MLSKTNRFEPNTGTVFAQICYKYSIVVKNNIFKWGSFSTTTPTEKNKNIFIFVSVYAIINMLKVKQLPIFGRVAQLGERLVRNEEVVGSIPITSTI